MSEPKDDIALIWAVHRTQDWWKHVGDHMGFAANTVVTDRRGKGDRWLTDDFYAAYRRLGAGGRSSLLSEAELTDIIARCRVLRWLPHAQASRMAHAMAEAAERLLDAVDPSVFVGFPIDSYVSDVIARRARARAVPCFEATASALPDMTMLMHRGRLIQTDEQPSANAIAARVHQIADPLFTPAYVRKQATYTAARFVKTLAYFQVRGLAFKGWSTLARDPLRCHLLDAQPGLGHKPQWRDMRVLRLIDADWEQRMERFPRDKRVLFGLQLIPEAAIDYWIEDLDLVLHEQMLVDAATVLADAGYMIVVKDHPLQFGHRQTALLEKLKALPNVVIVPYEISGNEMLARCGAGLTATGTLGLQAALLGNASIVGEAYYVTERDFIVTHSAADVASLATQLDAWTPPADLAARQARIIEHLLRGSFDAPFLTFTGFNKNEPRPDVAAFGRALGQRIRQLGPNGEDWHSRHMPTGGGRHEGSPLN